MMQECLHSGMLFIAHFGSQCSADATWDLCATRSRRSSECLAELLAERLDRRLVERGVSSRLCKLTS